MTTKGEWVAYTGSDEQIAEMKESSNFAIRVRNSHDQHICKYGIWPIQGDCELKRYLDIRLATHYLIANPHPLADMICQWARTGQPVWFKDPLSGRTGKCSDNGASMPYAFYAPDYYEYSFAPFKDTSK